MKTECMFDSCKLTYCACLSSNKEILSHQESDGMYALQHASPGQPLLPESTIQPPMAVPSSQPLLTLCSTEPRFSVPSILPPLPESSTQPLLPVHSSQPPVTSHRVQKPCFFKMKNHSLLHLPRNQSLFLMNKRSQFHKICLPNHYMTSKDLWMSMIFLIKLALCIYFCMIVPLSSKSVYTVGVMLILLPFNQVIKFAMIIWNIWHD